MLQLDGTTLVVGLGKSGLSAVRALAALGAAVAVTDSRRDPPGLAALRAEFPELPCHLGGFEPAVFADAARPPVERLLATEGLGSCGNRKDAGMLAKTLREGEKSPLLRQAEAGAILKLASGEPVDELPPAA